MFMKTEAELIAQIREDERNTEYYDWCIERLRDEYIENIVPMTEREFCKSCDKYEDFKKRCQKRIERNQDKLRKMQAKTKD